MVERGAIRLVVVGGRLLDADYATTLVGDTAPVSLHLDTGDGVTDPESEAIEDTKEIRAFRDASGRVAARVIAVVDRSPLVEQLQALNRGALIAVDNADELDRIESLAEALSTTPQILMRLRGMPLSGPSGVRLRANSS